MKKGSGANTAEIVNRVFGKVKQRVTTLEEGSIHTQLRSNPHATFESHHSFVNKEEPEAFANPCEYGARKPSEDVEGKPYAEIRRMALNFAIVVHMCNDFLIP